MNYSIIDRYLEKMIDLLEMSPLENQFQDFIVYPILDAIIHRNSICDVDLVDCHNFKQYNTKAHDRRSYSVLVKAIPDLLIAKDFFYNNRNKSVFDALNVYAAIEVKEPNNNWMLGKVFGDDDSKSQYANKLYVELLPSLTKNKKVILTNIRKWETYNTDNVKDSELWRDINTYISALELCGFDSFTDYEPFKENSKVKVLKESVLGERKAKLSEIQDIKEIIDESELNNKKSFDELVEKLDKKYKTQIKKFVKQSHECTWEPIKYEGKMVVNRFSNMQDGAISSISDINYDVTEWNKMLDGLYEFLFQNP